MRTRAPARKGAANTQRPASGGGLCRLGRASRCRAGMACAAALRAQGAWRDFARAWRTRRPGCAGPKLLGRASASAGRTGTAAAGVGGLAAMAEDRLDPTANARSLALSGPRGRGPGRAGQPASLGPRGMGPGLSQAAGVAGRDVPQPYPQPTPPPRPPIRQPAIAILAGSRRPARRGLADAASRPRSLAASQGSSPRRAAEAGRCWPRRRTTTGGSLPLSTAGVGVDNLSGW